MFNKIKGILSSKKFKIIVIALFMVVVIIVKVIDVNKSNDNNDKSPQTSANTGESTPEKELPGLHIGIGHIVMLIVFSAAYGIDRVIVYRNNLKDEQKYDNYKEK